MSAHVTAAADLFPRPAAITRERPDERTRMAAAVAYLMAFGVAVPVAMVVGLLTVLDPPEPPAGEATAPPAQVVRSSPAAGVAGTEVVP